MERCATEGEAAGGDDNTDTVDTVDGCVGAGLRRKRLEKER